MAFDLDSERAKSVAALQARRAARGMADPLNRLRAIGVNVEPITEQRAFDCSTCQDDPQTDCPTCGNWATQ